MCAEIFRNADNLNRILECAASNLECGTRIMKDYTVMRKALFSENVENFNKERWSRLFLHYLVKAVLYQILTWKVYACSQYNMFTLYYRFWIEMSWTLGYFARNILKFYALNVPSSIEELDDKWKMSKKLTLWWFLPLWSLSVPAYNAFGNLLLFRVKFTSREYYTHL